MTGTDISMSTQKSKVLLYNLQTVWLVESLGRLARAAVTLLKEPLTWPFGDTSTAPAGGTVPLSGCALILAVVVTPLLVAEAEPLEVELAVDEVAEGPESE